MTPSENQSAGDLLQDVLDEARETTANVEADLPNPMGEIAENAHYTMALVTASMPTAQEAAHTFAEAFRSLGISAEAL